MENCGNYFESNFSNDDHKLLDLSDGKLRTEDGHMFPIHKYVLAKRSKYFYALFCGMGEKKYDILIPGIKGEDLSNILSYLYSGNIHVTGENICSLIVASDYLLLDDLLSQIKPFLTRNLTFTKSLSIFKTALQISRDDFYRKSFRFVQTHFESIVYCQDSEICELPLDALELLLGDRNLYVRSERTVWLAITIWVEADSFNRSSWVPELLTYLAMSDIDENIASEILQHDIVVKNACCHEILDIKSRLYNADNLKVLKHYSQTHPEPMFALYDLRQPTRLHYVIRHRLEDIQVYLTYDENIDLWRKILDTDLAPEIVILINNCIYMFQIVQSRNLYYNVVEKQWFEMRDFITPREDYGYSAVDLDGLVYVLGGFAEGTDREIYDVEYYDSETDEWHATTPMIPVSSCSAITHKNVIYVIGFRLNDFGHRETAVQVYDPFTKTWNILPSPSEIIGEFGMEVYRDQIYVIGYSENNRFGNSVEVFDPIKNVWSMGVDVPYEYIFPKAIVFNDTLCVCSDIIDSRKEPVFQWNSDKKTWEHLEESPMSRDVYSFFTLENSESIKVIASQKKDPTIHFENGPFS